MSLYGNIPDCACGEEICGECTVRKVIELAQDMGDGKLSYVPEKDAWAVNSQSIGLRLAEQFGFYVKLYPSYTLNGSGRCVSTNRAEFETMLDRALSLSPISEVLLAFIYAT